LYDLAGHNLQPDVDASHLSAISKGNSSISIEGTRCKQITNNGWDFRKGKDQRVSSSINTSVEGEHTLLAFREVGGADTYFSCLSKKCVSIIGTRGMKC
jgi:hypothetical protein